jgi:hypothetical protein
MSHSVMLLAVIWLAYIGGVGTVGAAAGGSNVIGPRVVGSVATGGLFLALIASLLVFLA